MFLRPIALVALASALLLVAWPAAAQEERAAPPSAPVPEGVPPMPAGPSANPIGDLLGMTPKIGVQPLPALGEAGAPPLLQVERGEQGYDFELSLEERETKARQEAFDAALDGMMPLRPEEIKALLERYDEVQKSVETPHYPRPKPLVAVATASLDPGAQPVTVQVSEGTVTTVTFVDSSGAPWPVEDISWAGNFEVVESGSDDGTHILRITPQSAFAHGNMSVRLLELNTPLILTLDTARDQVHYRLDVMIPDSGPMAKPPLIETRPGPTAGGVEISRVLEGVVPDRFVRLAITGVDGRTSAYRDGEAGPTYLRTPLTLLSPGWSAHVASADGMQVYVIDAAPVVLLSDRGRMVRVYLSARGEDSAKQGDSDD